MPKRGNALENVSSSFIKPFAGTFLSSFKSIRISASVQGVLDVFAIKIIKKMLDYHVSYKITL